VTHHLSLRDVTTIRDQVARGDTWRFELVNFPGLVSALTTPFQSTFGQDSFPTLIEKAAAVVFFLVSNHPFRDGNKRIASAALRLFLQQNGQNLVATDDEMEAFSVMVAQAHEPRDPRIADWIAQALTPSPPLLCAGEGEGGEGEK
jgi:death-on-curing protein